MAKAIQHNLGSGIATVGVDTAKGSLWGILATGLIGAGLGALLLGGGGLLVAAGAAWAGAWWAGGTFAASSITWAPVIGTAIVGAIGGGVVGATGGGIGAGVGGLFGLLNGVNRVTAEQSAYQVRVANQGPSVNDVQRMQQEAYITGARDGQEELVKHIKAAQEAEAAQAVSFAQREKIRDQQRIAAANQPSGVGA